MSIIKYVYEAWMCFDDGNYYPSPTSLGFYTDRRDSINRVVEEMMEGDHQDNGYGQPLKYGITQTPMNENLNVHPRNKEYREVEISWDWEFKQWYKRQPQTKE
jgi:hypothetical protein